jgi:hypothetical protein
MDALTEQSNGTKQGIGFGVAIGIVIGVAAVAVGVYGGFVEPLDPNIQFGVLLIALGLSLIALCSVAHAVIARISQTSGARKQIASDLFSLLDELRGQRRILTQIAQNVLLSDATKAILRRTEERELFQRVIRENIGRQDWAMVDYLTSQLDKRFGATADAKALRSEAKQARLLKGEREISTGLARAEELFQVHDWADATQHISQLIKQFPSDNRIKALSSELEDRRERHKRRLLTEFSEAVKTESVDRAAQLIKDLDAYLTQNEATSLMDTARDVFKKHQQQLGEQFSEAVGKQNWSQAMTVGRKLIDFYPNTRFARDIKDRWSVLEKKANSAQAALSSSAAE